MQVLAATAVLGKKIMVRRAMLFMAELSLKVRFAIFFMSALSSTELLSPEGRFRPILVGRGAASEIQTMILARRELVGGVRSDMQKMMLACRELVGDTGSEKHMTMLARREAVSGRGRAMQTDILVESFLLRGRDEWNTIRASGRVILAPKLTLI